MRIRPKSTESGHVRQLRPVNEPRAPTDRERADVFNRNYKIGRDPFKARVMASALAPAALAHLYIFIEEGDQLDLEPVIAAIRAKIEAWHLCRTDDELRELLKNAVIIAIGSTPGDFENAIQIIPVVPTKYAQDLVAHSRLPVSCTFWSVLGPYGGQELTEDAIKILQAVINTHLTVHDQNLGRSSTNHNTSDEPILLEHAKTRMVSCAYYEGALPSNMEGSPAIILEGWNMGFIAPNQDSLMNAGVVIKGLVLHYQELHEKYGLDGRFWIALRDFAMGPHEAFVTQQVINRPVRLSDGRTVSFHVPGGYRSGYPGIVGRLVDDLEFWDRQRMNTSYFDVGLLRAYNQLDPNAQA